MSLVRNDFKKPAIYNIFKSIEYIIMIKCNFKWSPWKPTVDGNM